MHPCIFLNYDISKYRFDCSILYLTKAAKQTRIQNKIEWFFGLLVLFRVLQFYKSMVNSIIVQFFYFSVNYSLNCIHSFYNPANFTQLNLREL